MFFEKEELNIINKKDEELTGFLKKIDITFPITDRSSRYCAWAIYEGMNRLDLTQIEACSFGYMVSTFYGGMGLSCGTDAFFREEEIEYKLLDKLNDLSDINNIPKKAKLFYQEICDLYAHHIDEYAYKTETLSFRVSLGTKQRFDNVEGESFNDKLVYLIDKYNK